MTKRRGRNAIAKTAVVSSRVAVIDLETDPFQGPGYPVEPFAAGFYDGKEYHDFWGDDCVAALVAHLKSLRDTHVIYAHNGGKFDFMYLLRYLASDLFCIGPRIVRAYLDTSFAGENGDLRRHELRDSFAIVPVGLEQAADKLKFDYQNMRKDRREKFRAEIRDYLMQDCVGLHELVMTYRGVFGNALTMAGAAMRKLDEAMRPVLGRNKAAIRMTEKQDEYFRQWYFGGRVEAFESGIVRPHGNALRIYDKNSSYPEAMSTIQHPIGTSYRVGRTLEADTDFATIVANSDAALPWRNPDNGKLDFPRGVREFKATGHEIRTGVELGLLKILEVKEALTCSERVSFAEFISTYWEARKIAKRNSDKVFDLFWKLVMNGAYGKFAQNPREFTDTWIVRPWEEAPSEADGWVLKEYALDSGVQIYVRKLYDVNPQVTWRSYINVATGGSITGAARAALLQGIAAATRPIYCDTDSVICERLGSGSHGVRLSETELGGWKLEHEGDYAAICARKLYGFFGPRSTKPEVEAMRIRRYLDPHCIKIASKGVRLTAAQILQAAEGEVVEWQSEAPTFRRDGFQWWQKRRVQMTGTVNPWV